MTSPFNWQHSGLSVHATEPVLPDDTDRLELIRRRCAQIPPPRQHMVRYSWARLLRRTFEVDPLLCPQCGVEMRFVAVIQEATVVDEILAHLHRIGGNDPWEGTVQRGPPAA